MTPEQKRAYNKQYRAEGYGANADARYRAKNKAKLAEYMREYRRNRKRLETP
jgi:hypothetical protein